MSLDEQELHQHLEAVADRVSQPHFTIEGLIGRIRRRRVKIIGLLSGSLLTVAAIAVAVPIGLSGGSSPPTTVPAGLPFRLSFTVAVNGPARMSPKNGPSFTVTPGENLRITIGVTVPPHARVTILWLGVARGAFGPNRDGRRPIGLRPILARTRKPLTPGLHTFRLRWTVPTGLRRETTPLSLVATWESRQQNVSAGQFIAELVTPRRGRAASASAFPISRT